MNDKKLLELAAKAAGYKAVRYHKPTQDPTATMSTTWSGPWLEIKRPESTRNCRWNPLKNDGDALRLASELGIDLEFDGARVFAFIPPKSQIRRRASEMFAEHKTRSCATRRAIVRAAAEIGKEK